MSTRDDILSRVRGRLGVDPAGIAARRERVRQISGSPVIGPRPTLSGDLVERFAQKSLAMSSTLDRVATLVEVPSAVARYLAGLSLPTRAVAWPMFAALDWSGAGVSVDVRAPRDGDPVGITGCYCALAETGTLMLLSGPESPASTSLLPETHVAVVNVDRVVAGMEDGFAMLRRERGQAPRAINFVSGPSRTGDIEQTIVLGAHGPYRVHLILVG